jgi:ubiquinone/menaquinone biosynthesis C-methylase UbiE
MTQTTDYHLQELKLVNDPLDPRRCVPDYDCSGWDVLDVGCGIGQTLMAREFEKAKSRHGIDPDAAAVELGQRMFPALVLSVASAEQIPYPERSFDLVFSRVALPYTDVPRALRELARVTRPGGRLWLSLHSWQMQRHALLAAVRAASIRRLLDHGYILANSAWLAVAGRCIRRPWSHSFESFQIGSRIVRVIRRAGFEEVTCRRAPHFLVSARRVASVHE